MSHIRITINDDVAVSDEASARIRKRFLSVNEVAAAKGVSRQRILQLLDEGRIQGAYQLGGKGGQWAIPAKFTLKPRKKK